MSRAKRQPQDRREWYLDCFREFEQRLNGGAQTPLHALRREAAAHLAEHGLPTSRDESWRHSNPQAVTRVPFSPSAAAGTVRPADIEPHALEEAAALLVFADGRFVPGLSHTDRLPAGVQAVSIAESMRAGGADFAAEIARHAGNGASGFAALNTAFVEDGAALRIPARTRIEGPVQILHVSTGAGDRPVASFPRTLVVAEEGSSAAVVESFVGSGAGSGSASRLTNAVCEILLERGSSVEHCTLQQEGDQASHVGLLHVTESRDSRFTSTSASLSGRFLRRDVVTVLNGEGVESTLNGLYLGAGSEHIDNFTTVEHARPDCVSHELYKGVLGDSSTGVFRGRIHVHRSAQNTDAYQSNQNLLLSDDADVTSQPQLEIYADDVRCSHGSTAGELDEDALFYLQTRAIPRAEAVSVLARAFCGEVVDRVGPDQLRAHLRALADAKVERLITGG